MNSMRKKRRRRRMNKGKKILDNDDNKSFDQEKSDNKKGIRSIIIMTRISLHPILIS
jgi:hypothetical protein